MAGQCPDRGICTLDFVPKKAKLLVGTKGFQNETQRNSVIYLRKHDIALI